MRFLLDPLSSPVFCFQRSLSGCTIVLKSPVFYRVGRGSGKIRSFGLEAHRCRIWRPAKKCDSWNSCKGLGPSRVVVPKESRFNYNPESRIQEPRLTNVNLHSTTPLGHKARWRINRAFGQRGLRPIRPIRRTKRKEQNKIWARVRASTRPRDPPPRDPWPTKRCSCTS